MAAARSRSNQNSCIEVVKDVEGTVFDSRYQMQALELGTGVSGAVRAAMCRRTGRSVAVKIYDKSSMCAKELKNVISELAVHRTLAHPGVVKLEGVFESEARVHIVMERLYGGELFDRVTEKGRLSEREGADMARQLLETLVYLHGRRVLHRDVKLENIMFAAPGGSKIKLIDFGFATNLPASGKLTQRCGTIQYAAPEVLAGGPYDEKADLWSVGSVFFTILTGRPLFRGEDMDIIRKAKRGQVDYNKYFKTLSQEAQHFLERLLSVNPEERPTAQEALAHPWLKRARGHAMPKPKSMQTDQPGIDKMCVAEAALKIFSLGVMAVCGPDARFGVRPARR